MFFSVWDYVLVFSLISGRVESYGSLDGERDESRASMRWTRDPPDLNWSTCSKSSLSEIILALHQGSYNSPHSKHPMDLRFNHDHPIKIRRTRGSRAFPSSWDEIASWPSVRDPTVIEKRHRFVKWRLIVTVDRDESIRSDGWVQKSFFKNCSSQRKESSWIFVKFDLFRPPFHVSFDSLYSWCISASIECLKSKFYWKRKKNSHLKLQFLSSETRNEKPCIRRLIGSFRRLIWVRLRVFILIFHHLVLILHFES